MVGSALSSVRNPSVLFFLFGTLGVLLWSAPAASANGCTASALRITGPSGTTEPVRANPGFSPCVDDYHAAYRARGSAGPVKVVADSLHATTDDDAPNRPYYNDYESAEATVSTVTISSGVTSVSASGIWSGGTFECMSHTGECPPPFQSGVDNVSVNGDDYTVEPGVMDVPVPGLGTLHVNWSGPLFTQRALWLEGAPGMPDVVVAEVRGCRDDFGFGC